MPSNSNTLDLEERLRRAKSPASPPLTDKRDLTFRSRRSGHHTKDYGSDSNNSNHSGSVGKDYKFDYGYERCESPTSLTSSLSSSYKADRAMNTISTSDRHSSRRERNHLKDDSRRSTTMRSKRANGVLPSDGGAMIEIEKITALVEEELHTQRIKHKDQLNRTIAKFKERRERFQEENDHLRAERDEAKRELEKCKKTFESQKRAAERNERMRSQQMNRIESLEEQKELFEELQQERDALLDEISRAQVQQQKTKDELSALKVRVREDSQKRLSVMECLSTSWDSEQKEAKQKEALLNSELDIMAKTLKTEQDYLKQKNKEFDQLEQQYRGAKTELRSIKMSMIAKQEELDEELKSERESHQRVCEEHKQILKLKNDEIFMAETTIRNMQSELKSIKEKFNAREESMASLKEQVKKSKEKSDAVDPEVKSLRDENGRLKAEVKELQKQVESYLANMALQQEFCDSLKSRIYKEQENEQEQVEEIHKLRKRLKKQLKEAAAKDLQISQLKELLGQSENPSMRVESKSSRELKGAKKSNMKKPKSFAVPRKGGYRSS